MFAATSPAQPNPWHAAEGSGVDRVRQIDHRLGFPGASIQIRPTGSGGRRITGFRAAGRAGRNDGSASSRARYSRGPRRTAGSASPRCGRARPRPGGRTGLFIARWALSRSRTTCIPGRPTRSGPTWVRRVADEQAALAEPRGERVEPGPDRRRARRPSGSPGRWASGAGPDAALVGGRRCKAGRVGEVDALAAARGTRSGRGSGARTARARPRSPPGGSPGRAGSLPGRSRRGRADCGQQVRDQRDRWLISSIRPPGQHPPGIDEAESSGDRSSGRPSARRRRRGSSTSGCARSLPPRPNR